MVQANPRHQAAAHVLLEQASRYSLNTNVVTGLGMRKVCTEAVNVQKFQETRPKAKTRPAKKGTKLRNEYVQGRHTSLSAGIYTFHLVVVVVVVAAAAAVIHLTGQGSLHAKLS